MYELGWYCKGWPLNCDKVDYVLYECSLDFTGCRSLSIKYTSYYDDYFLELGELEQTGEIALFDASKQPSSLIFTYGEHPRCYVEGCETLENR